MTGAEKTVSPVILRRRVAAIGLDYRLARSTGPLQDAIGAVIFEVMAGIVRDKSNALGRKQTADADVRHALGGSSLKVLRNQSLLAIGLAGAFRRSQLSGLQLSRPTLKPHDLWVRSYRTKT